MASGLPDHIARPLRSGKWICPLFLFLSMAGYLTVMESTLRFESPRYFENRTARAVFEALLNDRSLYIQKGDIKVIDNTDVLNLFYTPQEVRALRGFVDRLNSQEPAFSISARDGVLSLQGVGQGDGASGLIRLVEEGLNKNIVYMERGEFCRLDEAAEKAIGAKINNDDIVRLILNEAKRERSSIRMTAAFNAAQGLAELKLAGNPFTIALAKLFQKQPDAVVGAD
jgi:hypothetical protein